MNNDELNGYIKHYIENDKTNRAIMLTAPWGTGKSFYIQQKLIPFLSDPDNGGYRCIVISLYGISSISEISKAIYVETTWDTIIAHAPTAVKPKIEEMKDSKSTALSKLQVGAKSILKGITSYFNVDLSPDEDSLFKLYRSVDLSKSLIILEDLERSELSVSQVLGYVNDLVEQDGVKVLLVANEDEILSYELSAPDKEGHCKRMLTKESVRYLKIKEKSIGDTINYQCDFKNAIKEIIGVFENDALSQFKKDGCVKNILEIMFSKRNFNLRTFLFACQKASDIFSKTPRDDENFNQTIFYSIIAFSMIIKNGMIPEWKGSTLLSPELGSASHPLYRFCYNYIRWQKFDPSEVEEAIKAHKKLLLFDSHGSRNDADLNIIYEYLNHTEQEVREALARIENRLNDPENIPIYNYWKLAYHLIMLHTILDYDHTACQDKMIQNIITFNQEIDGELLLIPITDFENEEEKVLFQAFTDKVKLALKSDSKNEFFTYDPEDLSSLYDKVFEKKDYYTRNHTFISDFDTSQLTEMLFECTPAQLRTFRRIMFWIYRDSSKHEFIEADVNVMKHLKDLILARLEECENTIDKIVLYQFRLITSNIDEFIEKIE